MTQPSILRTDIRFLIVNKPAGWLVHPTRPDGTFTLIDWIREQYPAEFFSLVSRLDRETSGLLLVARGKEYASILGKMQQRREIHKSYLAIVHGHSPATGVIDQPLDRLGKHQPSRIYIRQGVVPGTYPALTEFKTLEHRTHPAHGAISLLEASPKTGRLHQIRAHLESIGFPVVNDKIYGKNDQYFLSYIDKDTHFSCPRHCLHASRLVFHLDGEEIDVSTALPPDLHGIWDDAGSHHLEK